MSIKPVLRWAGGKRWLTKHIEPFLPQDINNYHEPFFGSGAIFFHIKDRAINMNGKCYLSDSNENLINFYKVLQSDTTLLIDQLMQYENNEETYYNLRSKQTDNRIEKAAIFYYLNRTSFNGLYRVNLKGKYNVPYGYKTYPKFIDTNVLNLASKTLSKEIIFSGDFYSSLANIKENDFVFIDPPYTVAHNRNGFIKYNKALFSIEDQVRLKKFIEDIARKNAYYFLTNAFHENIFKIFSPNSNVYELNRTSLISAKPTSRGLVEEYIFTNIEVNNG